MLGCIGRGPMGIGIKVSQETLRPVLIGEKPAWWFSGASLCPCMILYLSQLSEEHRASSLKNRAW